MFVVAQVGCGSLSHCPPQGKHKDRFLGGGGGFGSRTAWSDLCSSPHTQSSCSLVPVAEEVMARLVNSLIPSVRDAQEWLMKTELHLKEEGKEPLISG